MKRREAIRNTAFFIGGVISISSVSTLIQSCNFRDENNEGVSIMTERKNLLDEIVGTIIPYTDIKGAKEAGVGLFVIMMVTDCYPEAVQNSFLVGLNNVNTESEKLFNKQFVGLNGIQREKVLKIMELVEKDFMNLICSLTKQGYYTSEIGVTEALSYVGIPGRYDSCVKLEPSQKAWAI